MPARVQFRDLGIEQLKRDVQALRSTKITIGWQGPSGAAIHPGSKDTPIAQVAAWHEHGTPQESPGTLMPARPSLKITFKRHGREFVASARKAVSDLIDGRVDSVDAAVEQVGEAAVAALRATIDDARSWAEPLAESTARAKGHDQPLVETFTMRNAASWASRVGDSIERQGGEETT